MYPQSYFCVYKKTGRLTRNIHWAGNFCLVLLNPSVLGTFRSCEYLASYDRVARRNYIGLHALCVVEIVRYK